MNPPLKIGLAAVCADWFMQVGLQTGANDLGRKVREDYARMAGFLRTIHPAVVAPGIIATVREASAAAAQFRGEAIDALLLVHIMWSEDQPLLALLDGCRGLPLLLWNYHPTGFLPRKMSTDDLFRFSGTVGMLQGSAVLQKRGLAPLLVSGTPGDSALRKDLQHCVAALAIHKEFKGMRAGRIAGRCEVMTGTWVNPQALHTRLGVNLVEITARQYATACSKVAPQRVAEFVRTLRATFPVRGVSEASLQLAGRNTLALDDLAEQHDLHALAIQDLDPDLHRLAGIRPCLCPPGCARRGVAIGVESDLNVTLGLLAAMRASGAPGMFTEIFTFDPRANTLLMGHAAVHDPRVAGRGRVTIVPDYEYRKADRLEGAWQELIFARGRVSCVGLYDTGTGYRMTLFEGQSLGAPLRLQGFAHALVRPDIPARDLLPRLVRLGLTQHFAIVPGRVAAILEPWCRLQGIAFVAMQADEHASGRREAE